MQTKKVLLTIEASKTSYSIYSDDFPAHGVGDTIELAKANLQSAINELLTYYKEVGKEPDPLLNGGNLEFIYQYDL